MVKAAGGSASAHWIAVGPRAFNAPEVVLPAMERVKEKITASNERAQLLEVELSEPVPLDLTEDTFKQMAGKISGTAGPGVIDTAGL